jgi:hypothetical protein
MLFVKFVFTLILDNNIPYFYIHTKNTPTIYINMIFLIYSRIFLSLHKATYTNKAWALLSFHHRGVGQYSH